jgi:membrane-bound lytic murein transglycosylase A
MKSRLAPHVAFCSLAVASLLLTGCAKKHGTLIPAPQEDVESQLNPGEWGLEKIDPKDYPDMRNAFADRVGLQHALEKSLQWLSAKSSQRHFDGNGPITHDQIQNTLQDMLTQLQNGSSAEAFQQRLLASYDVYRAKGFDRKGSVWFTAYYTPIFYGSTIETSEYKYPIYKRPADLKSDPITGDILGRQASPNGPITPYPTRKEITDSNMLKGTELYWFKDPLEPYIIQVQGSAKVVLPDGTSQMIGYDGKNGREYRGIGRQLVDDGKIEKKQLSLPAVIAYFKQHPDEEATYINRNDSFAFLKIYDASEWPSGSLGVQVTANRSLATDKSVFPRSALTFIDAAEADESGTVRPYDGFILDQDTGGAIRAAGRADIYMGIGDAAGKRAGVEFSQGKLYYIFLKPDVAPLGTPYQAPVHVSATKHTKRVIKPTTPGGPTAPMPTGGSSGDEIFPGAKH